MITSANSASVSRMIKLMRSIRQKEIEGLLVTDMSNVRYLSRFSGSSGFLLIGRGEKFFVTDFRYKEQSEREVRGWEIVIETRDRLKTIQSLCKKNGIRRLGFESSVSYRFFERLSKIGVSPVATEGLVERLRLVKDTAEIGSIREAITRAEGAFLDIKPYIRAGAREISLALRMEAGLRRRGCRRIPFDTIVASGPNSAMPHARPTERKLERGDLVTFDWGGESDGYCSDMTRTVLIGGGRELGKKKEIYEVVLKANRKAISRVSAGVRSSEIDRAAREFISKAGYGEYFGHGTGHGVGIQVHEAPRISRYKPELIAKGMVFTLEPGIYLPGIGGVRIEDMVLVRDKGAEVLTSLKKDMEIV